ncbi:MAG: hypothetical protein ACI4E2_01185 [Acetatifactor sp.]
MIRNKLNKLFVVILRKGLEKEKGIDGILVTVGLCIIALLLCVVMKDSLATFVTTIVQELTKEAKTILSGVSGAGVLF